MICFSVETKGLGCVYKNLYYFIDLSESVIETMTTIKSLAMTAKELKAKGMSEMEIANELHLSVDTVDWLLTHSEESAEKRPVDIRIGWRSVGIYPKRIRSIAEIIADIIMEEMEKRARHVDTICGIAINGIPLVTFVGEMLDTEIAIYKPHPQGELGPFLSNFASLERKHVVVVDDVLGTGRTLSLAIDALRNASAIPELAVVFVNKTPKDEINGVPLRGVVRAISTTTME